MKKTLVSKSLLSKYRSLLIVLENCESYEIDTDDILDIYCVTEPADWSRNGYRTNDGFIKIAARASQTQESYVLQDPEAYSRDSLPLKERLELCGGVDMTCFSLKNDGSPDMDIYVPYDPLECIMNGGTLELSNCPSLETDGEGNMIIAFGKRSKQPKRRDNNYAELIEGWSDEFGAFKPRILKARAEDLHTFGDTQTNLSFSFKLCNKGAKKDFAKLVFIDCKDISFELFFPKKGNCSIFMSRMADGNIYVGLDGLGITFICSSVQEYNYYCTQDIK